MLHARCFLSRGGTVRLLNINEVGFEKYLSGVEARGGQDTFEFEREVRSILKAVRGQGDRALVRYTRIFDGVRLPVQHFRIKKGKVKAAYRKIPREFLGTLEKAADRIRTFHDVQKNRSLLALERKAGSEKGITLGQVITPLERVGIYVPGGKASYPSTVLMAAIPAKVAGVRDIVMVTPPRKGGVSPAVLVAADIAGVDRIYQIGGVQAIGALAYGTRSIPKVDKIVGPGNRYVAAAKKLVFGVVDIDMVAGPSEIVVISDEKTPPSYVAADLISQAEHDEMALCLLITPSQAFGVKVREELEKQLASSERKKIARTSLNRRGAILVVRNLKQAVEVANRIAPEHLELAVSNPSSLLKQVRHAGAVFLGPYTPEAIGDYLAGPNHILPTAGTARFSSSLGPEDFMKRTNLIGFTRAALKPFEKDVQRFTEWEGLKGHYRAVQLRLKRR
jgi:histidinol dehydrogenase